MKIIEKSIFVFIFSILLSFIVISCKDEKGWTLMEESAVKLNTIKEAEVINGHGQALIRYKLDQNQDLLYVKAEYVMENGKKRIVKSSKYKNEILIDGFPNTNPHIVELYAVNKNEEESEPYSVEVKPKSPVFDLVFSKLEVSPTFGGVRITSENEFKGNVTIVPLVDSTNSGEYLPLDNLYTQDSLIIYNVRGLSPREMNFAFYIRDRWLNTSDTLFANLTPFEENLIDRELFNSMNLPGDARFMFDTNIEMMWDGNLTPSRWPALYTDESAGEPQVLSFSLGKEVKLSRVVIFPRREEGFYDKGNLRDFEIWGSNHPDLDGSFDSWDKLGTYSVKKPSGLPAGTDTGADEAYGVSGWSFDIPDSVDKYKYLRIRNLRNWRGSYFMQIAQIQVWGVY